MPVDALDLVNFQRTTVMLPPALNRRIEAADCALVARICHSLKGSSGIEFSE